MLFYPKQELSKKAYIKSFEEYKEIYNDSKENFHDFWEEKAKENLTFFTPFEKGLNEESAPFYKWFEGWKVNLAYECVDKNLEENADKVALIFEAENGESQKVTYKELSKEVNKSANLLKSLGITKWDRIVFYMPMILESVYLMLATLRLWAIHSIVFGWFSAESLKDRIEDAKAKLVITADGAFRRWEAYTLKPIVDKAISISSHKPEKTLVVKRNFAEIDILENDVIYNDLISSQSEECDFELMDSEDTSFILYTSGSTGKPKWIMHSTAWYWLWAKLTTKLTFDAHPWDIFWSSADIWWITGHSYTVYWPLMNGITTVIYEWNPVYPTASRPWEIIEKHWINKFYTAPTLIRMLYKMWKDLPKKHDLSKLEILWTVWEPIWEKAWKWFYEEVWNSNASIVDTYWQTETWGHILTPLPWATPTKPGSATFPLPWIMWEVVDENMNKIENGENWYFVIEKPWPGMARWIWGDEKRFLETYFKKIDEKYYYISGDWAYRDNDWYIFITWRVDDILNISGHRLGTAEIESSIAKHQNVAEVSVIWKNDELTWESIFAYIILKDSNLDFEYLQAEINQILREDIWPVAKVKDILVVPMLPKTRSWKILRRVLRDLANGKEISGDLTTIEEPKAIEEIISLLKKDQ